ncbi:unnamed protein product [Clonostachys rosea f. rosea IK726]|jgi:hypothetical protein|uniref:Uncharacterized protein n=2 Tax=Bionectria ochroleuca TaxID=29856 RepID=A0A8H7NMX6_BIOOC|nr:unnamed protein product [Clonostachys rosea f. rosea IK726]
MANYDAAFEELIGGYRKNRRLLTINNISFKATRAEFQTAARAKYHNSDKLTFYWPPAGDKYRNPRHTGCVYLGVTTREEATRVLSEFQD